MWYSVVARGPNNFNKLHLDLITRRDDSLSRVTRPVDVRT